MYVCICRGITSNQVAAAVCQGASCVKEVNKCIGIPVQCGKCCTYMKTLVEELVVQLS